MMRCDPLALVVLALVLITGCRAGEDRSQEAEQILNSVSERYKQMETFELEGTMASQVITGDQSRNMEFPVYYARKKPGNMRIEVRGENFDMTLVSDGNTTWTHVPSLNEYTRRQSARLQTGGTPAAGVAAATDFTGMGEQFTKSYENITSGLTKARLLSEETVTLEDGSEHEVYKVEAEYRRQSDMSNARISPTVYLIGKDSALVLRQDVQISTAAGSAGGNTIMLQTLRLRSIDLSPEFGDTLFAFTPPDSAVQVGEFSMSGLSGEPRNELIGKKAPGFELTSFGGERVSLESLEGSVILLDFWATWCGPCLKAHPHIQKLHEDLQEEGLVVLGINSEEEQKVMSYIRHNEYTFVNLKDSNQSVASRYNVNTIPSVYIIDREGVVSSHLLGYQPEKRLREAIEKAGLQVIN